MRRPFPIVLFAFAAPVLGQWYHVPVPTLPPAQREPLLTYDFATTSMLMLTAYGIDREMWLFDGSAWTQLVPATIPTIRRGSAMQYDLVNNVTVLCGGTVSSPTSIPNSTEVWLWDGVDWSLGPPMPVGLARHSIAFDQFRGRTVVYGGSLNIFAPNASDATLEFDGTNWTVAVSGSPPGPREDAAMCFMTATGQSVLFGGDGQNGFDDETWLYDGVQWTMAPVTGPRPSPRLRAEMVYDTQRGVCLLFGGEDVMTGDILNDTWEFDGAVWRETGQSVLPARKEFGMGFDPARLRPVLFGGRLNGGAIRNDTWEYGSSNVTYGNGCSGTWGTPQLVGTAPPVLGGTATVTLSNLDPNGSLAFLVVGLSRTTWPFGSLPASLSGFGLTNCVAYASPDLFVVLGASGGTAVWNWPVPNDINVFGQAFYQQGLSIDPGRNPAGLVTSNANRGTLGW